MKEDRQLSSLSVSLSALSLMLLRVREVGPDCQFSKQLGLWEGSLQPRLGVQAWDLCLEAALPMTA